MVKLLNKLFNIAFYMLLFLTIFSCYCAVVNVLYAVSVDNVKEIMIIGLIISLIILEPLHHLLVLLQSAPKHQRKHRD